MIYLISSQLNGKPPFLSRLTLKTEYDVILRYRRSFLSTVKGDFYPKESRRVTGCVGKSREFAISIVGNEIFQAVGRYFLSTQLQWNWVSPVSRPTVKYCL